MANWGSITSTFRGVLVGLISNGVDIVGVSHDNSKKPEKPLSLSNMFPKMSLQICMFTQKLQHGVPQVESAEFILIPCLGIMCSGL